jgi:acid phosphatase (class A)
MSAAVLVLVVGISGCAGFGTVAETAPGRHGKLPGYLTAQAVPDSSKIIPPPPADGTAALQLDREISAATLPLRNSPRWKLAAEDAELSFPEAAETFSCALDAPISEKQTPHLYRLMQRMLADVGQSTGMAKNLYKRPRPFVVNGEPTCSPAWEKQMRTSGSYPSSHSAIGWAWALILSEVAPERGDQLLVRGISYGQSRIICNVHWQTDVIEGREIGAAVVARLHAEPSFRDDIAAAAKEVAALRAKGTKPLRQCTSETEALRILPQNVSWPANR